MRLVILSLLSLISFSLLAETAEEKGLAIAQEADKRNTGWKDSKAKMEMVLINKRGDTSTRKIHVQTLEMTNDGDKSLTVFDEPKDVKGTAFLSFSHAIKPDEQWLYLPALKRVKRISSGNKSGPFMGSEFAYEDLSSFEIEKYKYKYLRDEKFNDIDCFVVEMYPQYKKSGYKRRIAWIDKDEYRIQKIEFYDRKNSLLKTLDYSDYKQYLNQYWRAHSMLMKNHQTEKSTRLTWQDYQFQVGIKEKDFNKNKLKQAR